MSSDHVALATQLNRRKFLRTVKGLSGLGALCALPAWAGSRPAAPGQSSSQLLIHNINTGESSQYIPHFGQHTEDKILRPFNHIMRDWRNGEVTAMDPRLLIMLSKLHADLGKEKPINLISAYRSPATNEMLRRNSNGVAKGSYHTRGQAIDFSIPGVPLRELRDAAASLKAGGVGFYPGSGFVHIDTGPVRYWG